MSPKTLGNEENSNYVQQNVCPECGSTNFCKDGKRVYDGVEIQRYLCRDCETRFSDRFSEQTIKSNAACHDDSQLCAILEAKKLETATENNKVAGEIEKRQQEAKGKILELCIHLKRQNYSEETIRLNRIALKVLMDRGAYLFDSDSVKDVIAKQHWSGTDNVM